MLNGLFFPLTDCCFYLRYEHFLKVDDCFYLRYEHFFKVAFEAEFNF